MRKGELTRQMIIARTAAVLNQRGYYASSLADIMAATGMEKGGIYNHFASKDELALAAFDYAVEVVWQRLRAGMAGKSHAADRLVGLMHAYREMADAPPLPGWCPLLNTGVESSGTHPALRDRARQALTSLQTLIVRVIERGQARGELRPTVDAVALVPILIGAIEGGVFFTKLYEDPSYLHRAVDHVVAIINTELRQTT